MTEIPVAQASAMPETVRSWPAVLWVAAMAVSGCCGR